MRMKHNVRKVSKGVLSVLFGVFFTLGAGATLTTANAEETTSETSVVTNLYTPTATGENYIVGGFGDWKQETTVEDYADSPSGKVLHQTIDNTNSAGGETWPGLKINIPYTEDASDFAGYIVWLEYTGEVYSDSNYWGLFNFTFGNDSNTVSSGKAITFIDANGKIDETKTGGWCYHRNNMTAIENSGYANAYSYAFKGYMIIPKETLTGSATAPSADRVIALSHHYKKTITMDLKIGEIGFYTDYDAVLNEYGRCNYTFVDYDGTVVKTEAVKPNTVVEAPEYENTFTKDGRVYSFLSWSGYTAGMKITSDVTFNASYKVRDFHMVKGASIRTNKDTSGIRFTAEFDENLYNEVTLNDNKEFGMLITSYDYYTAALESSEDLITGLNSLGANKYALITQSSKNPVKPYKFVEESMTMYRINGALTNITYSHADWKWVGIGVIITTTSEGTEYLYCAYNVEDVARTTAYVASAALNNPEEDFDEVETVTVKNYVYKTAAKLANVTEADFNATEDKTTFLNGYSLEVGDGLDTSKKFNTNLAGKEAYLEIGKASSVSAQIVNANGGVLDVAYTLSAADTSVLDVNGTTLTALKNGYSKLTMSCELFGYSEEIMVYTGSEDAGNRANAVNGSNVNASKAGEATGEIDGVPYYWYQYQLKESAHIYASYPDMSVYYIDYLLSQGYKYLRVPFYFDTTRWAELGATSETQVTAPYITTWIPKAVRVSGAGDGTPYHFKNVPANEWCYFDMDLNLYRMSFAEATGAGVDAYGMKLKASSYYQYMIMKFCSAYSYVYTGQHTFIKESTVAIDASNDSVSFGDTVVLSDYYATDVAVKYTVNGVEMDSMAAISATNNVTISANVFTTNVGTEGNRYVIGNDASWKITYGTFAPVEKTLNVVGGIEGLGGGEVVLVDVKDGVDVNTSTYTKADLLKGLDGFTVTETYVKRYSDGSAVESSTISATERGVFYLNVVASNGLQSLEYSMTLDLYNSNEPIEYESFGHADSQYAIKAYYGARNTASEGLYDVFESYEKVSSFYVTGTKNADGKELYGVNLTDSFNTYFSLNKYGDEGKDTSGKASIQTVYGYDDTTISNFTYLALDGNKFQLDGPIKVGDGTSYSVDAFIAIYVLPRHTQEYYVEFAKENGTSLMKVAYAEPMTGGSVVQNFLTGVSGDVNNPTCAKTKKQNYSANWQPELMTKNNQTITVQTIATYYNAFDTMRFPMLTWSRPAGRGASSLSNNVLKLGTLIF